jgi:hypothetical protein
MALRIGYALFKGASQAGVAGDLTPGNVEIEVDQSKTYKLQVQRLADSEYWNDTTKAWQAGDPTTDDITVPGSLQQNGAGPAHQRLIVKPSLDMCLGIDADGVLFTAYPSDDVAANGASVQVNQALN